MKNKKRFFKDSKNGKISGVCAGIANYFDADVALIRLIFLTLLLFKGAGLLFYVICSLAMSSEDEMSESNEADNSLNLDKDTEKNKRKSIVRDTKNEKIFGVCAGIAKYFNVDVTLIRIITILLTFVFDNTILLYIILTLVMDTDEE